MFLCVVYQLAYHLAQKIPSVKTGVVLLPKEGCCIRFNPILSSRCKFMIFCFVSKITMPQILWCIQGVCSFIASLKFLTCLILKLVIFMQAVDHYQQAFLWVCFLLFSVCGTTSENIEDFVICLKKEVVSVLFIYSQTSRKRPPKMQRCNGRVVHSVNTEIRPCIKCSLTRDWKQFGKLSKRSTQKVTVVA